MLCDIYIKKFIDMKFGINQAISQTYTIVMYPAGDPVIQTLKFLIDQDLHNF